MSRGLAARCGSAVRLLLRVVGDPLHHTALGTEYLGSSHGQFSLAVTLDAVHHLALRVRADMQWVRITAGPSFTVSPYSSYPLICVHRFILRARVRIAGVSREVNRQLQIGG